MKRSVFAALSVSVLILVVGACSSGGGEASDPGGALDVVAMDATDSQPDVGPGTDVSPPRDAGEDGNSSIPDTIDVTPDQGLTGECDTDGDTRTVACGGINGRATLEQSCILGLWTDAGECEDPDLCTDGATRDVPCQDGSEGDETQECREGRWAYLDDCRPAAPCTDDDVRTAPCGKNGNGTLTQVCIDSAWQNDGECDDPDECRNGAERTESCGVNGIGMQTVRCVDGRFQAGECLAQFENKVRWPRDIRTVDRLPRVYDLMEAGGRVFVRIEPEPGAEDLLFLDGPDGPARPAEPRFIRQGRGAPILGMYPAGNHLFIQRDDGIHGAEPWLTDGTEAGTRLMGDVVPGTRGSMFNGTRTASDTFDGRIWFFAVDEDGMHLFGDPGDWTGVRRLAAVFPVVNHRFVQMGGNVYFAGDTHAHGTNLWRSDGTPGGTMLVRDLRPGTPDGKGPEYLTVYRGRLYFRAEAPDGQSGLWTSDGTEAGTVLLVTHLGGATVGGSPSNLTVIDDRLYYSASRDTASGEVWRTDGTAAGTVQLTAIGGNAWAGDFNRLGDHLVFTAKHGTHDRQWWKLPLVGPNPEATLVKVLTPGEGTTPGYYGITPFGGRIYFTFLDTTGKRRLYSTDGSNAGTRPEAQRDPTLEGEVDSLYAVGGHLYVTIDVDVGQHRLYRVVPDGSAVEIPLPPNRSGLKGQPACTLPDGRLVFLAEDDINGVEPWVSDGTNAGTSMAMVVNTSTSTTGWTEGVTCFGNVGVFRGAQADTGVEPWVTGGDFRNTRILRDMYAGTGSGSPTNLAVIGSRLYFRGNDSGGYEPWQSDGTNAGTIRLSDVVPGSGSSQPAEFTGTAPGQAGEVWKVFFRATSDAHREELWVHDGTETRLVKDIAPGQKSGRPAHLASLGDHVYFSANDGSAGRELWRSDGTQANTVRVADILPGEAGSYPDGLVAWTGRGTAERILFAATDGTYGRELREASSKGVTIVADLAYRVASSNPTDLHVNGNRLLMSAVSGNAGRELVIVDLEKKVAATVDIRAGRDGSDPHGFISWDGTWTFFSANDGIAGQELWLTDGTAQGTRRVADLNPGPEGSYPWILGRGGDLLYVQAWTPEKGLELVVLDLES
jgi:ELWxxDGT repeat protein